MEDLREAVDTLRDDMARHQRLTGVEVSDARNHSMAADLVQRIEREQADAKPFVPMPYTFTDERPRTRQERRREIREGQHGRYIVDANAADDTKVRKANEAELWYLTHAMPRVELLLSKMETGPLGQPSWHQRVMAVMALRSRVPGLRLAGLHTEAADTERRFMFELSALLEDSIATFGDWKADKPRLVMVG